MSFDRRQLLRLTGAAALTAAMPSAFVPMRRALAATGLPFAMKTPVTIDAAALKVRDLDNMIAFYGRALGLNLLERGRRQAILGTDGTPLLTLLHRPNAEIEPSNAAGLFHIAYLMPTRQDLARWIVHAATTRIPIDGVADHSVSEAIYLRDPEGNGIEVYSDRPPESWQWQDGTVTMGTKSLDLDDILTLADRNNDDYAAAPSLLRIGHVHLRVGDIAQGRHFYQSLLGLDSTRGERGDAAFLSSGGYHHHIAMNIWNSSGAGRRNPTRTGLDWFALRVSDSQLYEDQLRRFHAAGTGTADETGLRADDPWGTQIRLIRPV